MDKVQKIREEVERLQNELIQEREKGFGSDVDDACILELQNVLTYIDSLQEEPISELLNTESMIESYKQRLISQANGLRSPLIDMCLSSYKHGINETLDTLKLSNLVRIGKNWEKPKFKVGDRIKFKGVRNEDVTRVITNIQKGDGGGFRYLFADGSIYSIGDDGIELVEEPISEDLEEAAIRYAKEEYNHKNPATLPDRCRGCYAPLMYAFKAGAKWQKEQTMKDAIEIEGGEFHLNFTNAIISKGTAPFEKCKVKMIIIKEE